MIRPCVHIIGAGLAGSEAAYFLAEKGVQVILHEMRPLQTTHAHQTGQFAELVCSNSFKSKKIHSAPGMLKTEMQLLDSLILHAASLSEVPAGEALAVDRVIFSEIVSSSIKSHPNIKILYEETTEPLQNYITILATGPLTSEKLSKWISQTTNEDLYFYDAISPIIDASSIDTTQAFVANRYEKGDEQAYINCPINQNEYEALIDALLKAEKVAPKNFEKEKFFQGCQPIEAIAEAGRESLRFGPMKPVGLIDPKTGKKPYAVLQLRQENLGKTAYHLVGFQTKLKYKEQKEVFSLIPALKKAEFLRFGSIHRNTYICGPKLLHPNLSLKKYPKIFFAGQLTGVEGYLESAATGLLVGIFVHQMLEKKAHSSPPANTALGALLRHITGANPKNYGPSNIHFGLFDSIFFNNLENLNREDSRKAMAQQASKNFLSWSHSTNLLKNLQIQKTL